MAGHSSYRRAWRLLAAIAVAMPLAGAARVAAEAAVVSSPTPVRGGLPRHSLQVDSLERTYSVYVPVTARATPAVVLALHGGSGGTGERLRGFVGAELEAAAEEHGFIVVYPDGVEGSWNDCRRGAPYPAAVMDVDDVGFVRALVAELERTHGADPRRIFAIGYSNGGQLAFRVALTSPGTLRGIAAIGANLPADDAIDCRLAPAPWPLTVLLIAGTDDAISPYDGGDVVLPDGTALGRVRSAPATMFHFARLAGYGAAPAALRLLNRDEETGTSVKLHGFSGRGPAVALITVVGGGHTIPTPVGTFPETLGAVERRLSGVGEAVRMFALADDET